MNSKPYPAEFNIETVRQVTERAYPVVGVASRLYSELRAGIPLLPVKG